MLIALFQIWRIRHINSPLSFVISRLEVSFHCACELVHADIKDAHLERLEVV
jgi:hypothetical protein